MTIAIAERIEVTPRAKARAIVKTRAGRLALVLVFTGLIAGLQMSGWWVIGIVLALTSAFPEHRKVFLIPAAAAFALVTPAVELDVLRELAPQRAASAFVKFWPVAVPIVWAMAFVYLGIVHRFPKSIVAKRPVIGLVGVLCMLMAASALLPLRGFSWLIVAAITMCFAQYLWFFAYWVSENHTRAKSKSLIRTGFWRPFWGFTNVPYGKGAAYLEKVEAKDDDELATSQIKGMKLIFWAIVLTAMIVLVNKFVYRVPPGVSLTKAPYESAAAIIPTYQMSLDAMQAGRPYAVPVRWLALILFFLLRVAGLTVWGAKVIAVARMAGFNAFRNTYRPFEALTIMEFYNRIYYYFKELLVTFFFFPAYLRYFKKRPKVRLFMATLAAAGLGNWMFHFLRDQELIFRHGFWAALLMYRSYAVYALILGVAISVSQMRSMANKGKLPVGLAKVRAFAVIMLFYLLICIFEEPNTRHGLGDYVKYCVGLFVP